ncbi:hypothetical protein HPB49_013149 [Dermacentor silvarum]|uniref:Uncharacterized protein n=1 Tax=Dermacentor silvarum TaxID=543639 RepID=A0ACB8CXG9_DERSI|nr:hypothetical protein HPB49_013149 [Dermacentor silvarum]
MLSKPDSEGWTLVNRRKNAPFNTPTATTSFTSQLHGHKVILRPQGGFVLTILRPTQLMSAVSAAACLIDNEYKETQVEIQEHKNLAVFVSTRNYVAQKLAQLTTLTIQATSHQVSIYLVPPDNSCRGIVHGIEAHTTSAELMANLDAPGFTILSARMMGKTETALITFHGNILPYTVLYYRAIYRCKPHYPRAQQSIICLKLGHRADVCPTPQHLRCPICAVAVPVYNAHHTCAPNCANCNGAHPATDPACPSIQAANKAAYQATRLRRAPRPPPPPPFSPDVAASRSNTPQRHSPSRSRSRTPDSSR